jgi:hypothetical protein
MMKMRSLITVSVIGILGPLLLTSCDTPVGQGAAWGAATGAIIGGAATGNVRAASLAALRQTHSRACESFLAPRGTAAAVRCSVATESACRSRVLFRQLCVLPSKQGRVFG